MTKGQLEGRVCLITGASRGLGAALAEAYAGAGAQLILTARTAKDLEKVDDRVKAASPHGHEALLVPADLSKNGVVEELSARLHERYGRVDAVVGNAAQLGGMLPVHQVNPKHWEQAVRLNVTANLRLIRSFDPLLRLSDAGRFLFIGSEAVRIQPAYMGVYSATKAALESLVCTYAKEVEDMSIRANIISPGVLATDMRAEGFPGEDQSKLPKPEDIAAHFTQFVAPTWTLNGQVMHIRDFLDQHKENSFG